MAWKRLAIALVVGILVGIFCAYGTAMANVPGLVVDFALLATIFFNRLLIGLVVGLAGWMALVKGKLLNSALRGAILGALVSVGISFYGGGEILILFGMAYGLIADVVATRFGE
ncbi:MAG: hypothetical protein QXH30_03730 [Candidatus Bilamarchaeaceae archaeon]